MPSYYDKPAVFANGNIEDVNRFNKLPFYLVKNEIPQFAAWNEFDQLYGKINWQANQGDIMKGVTPQRSPVARSFFFPNAITTLSNKDIYQVTESVEQAVVRKHRAESFQFNFLPSFDAFWDTYIKFNSDDIVRQIACSNNQFIETNMWFNASNVWLCGTGLISNAPIVLGNAAGTVVGSKTPAWLLAATSGQGNAGVTQGLTLRDVYGAIMTLQNDLGAPAFSGVKNMPKDNEGIKGSYALYLSPEAWMNFTFDRDTAGLKSINLDLLFNDFRGMLFGKVTCKIKKYPVRYSNINITDTAGTILWAAGQPIDPEIMDEATQKWIPNPYYTSLISAPFEIGWLLGDGYAKTIKVGPPPKEFAATSMSGPKFYGLKWNGEVRITDQLLEFDANGVPSLNTYGEQLKLESQQVYGYLVGERRFAFPMILRRHRPLLSV